MRTRFVAALVVLAATAALLCSPGRAWGQNLVTNGDFSQQPFGNGWSFSAGGGSADASWDPTYAQVSWLLSMVNDPSNSPQCGAPGFPSCRAIPSAPASVFTTVATTPGTTYFLSWEATFNPVRFGSSSAFSVLWGDDLLARVEGRLADASASYLPVIASGTSTRLRFVYEQTGVCTGFLCDDAWARARLDNVVLTTTTPEPSTWALMGTGLLGLGALARRRRRLSRAGIARLAGTAAVGIASILSPAALTAQQWATLPNGSYAWETPFTTTGTLACGSLVSAPGSTCALSGQDVVLTTGDRSVRLAFSGVTSSLSLALGTTQQVSLGEIVATFDGSAPAAFPIVIGDPLVRLALSIQTPGALFPSRWFFNGYSGPPNTLPPSGQNLVFGAVNFGGGLPTTPTPSGQRGYALIFHEIPSLVLTTGTGRVGITATATLAPEPGTWALMGTGLLAIGGVAARRKRAV